MVASLASAPAHAQTNGAPNASPNASNAQMVRGAARMNASLGTLRTWRPAADAAPLFSRTPAGALAWLLQAKAPVGTNDPLRDFVLAHAAPAAADGTRTFTFQRTVTIGAATLDVVDARMAVVVNGDGRVRLVTGQLPSAVYPVEPNALLTDEDAIALAEEHLAPSPDAPLFGATSVRQVVWAHDAKDRGAVLAWDVQIGFARTGQVPVRAHVYVDARSGEILAQRSLIHTLTAATCHGFDNDGFDRQVSCAVDEETGGVGLVDVQRLNGAGIFTTNAFNTDNLIGEIVGAFSDGTVPDAHGISAHRGILATYDYMQQVHDRPDWNHRGGDVDLSHVNTVDHGVSFDNAFATIVEIEGQPVSLSVFGNGGQFLSETSSCLDVAGHELFHNVIAADTGLVYEGQSGALNEHLADAFGTAIDYHFGDGDDLMGEDCAVGGAIRSMANPEQFQQPSHMNDFVELPVDEANDFGGVHINSGILNKAYFEMYSARGIEVAERIWYRAMTQGGLGARSDFADFVVALTASCDGIEAAAVCADLDGALASVGLATSNGGNGGGDDGCPPNSSPINDTQCACDEGFEPNAELTACVAIGGGSTGGDDDKCPEHSHAVSETECACDEGFEPNDALTACVAVDGGPVLGGNDDDDNDNDDDGDADAQGDARYGGDPAGCSAGGGGGSLWLGLLLVFGIGLTRRVARGVSGRAAPVLAATAALAAMTAACGGGDANGFGGVYAGGLTMTFDGDIEITNASGQRSSGDLKSEIKRDADLVIDGGEANDAIVTGDIADCALPLNVDGEQLVLAQAIECLADDSDNDITANGGTVTSSSETRTKFTRFSIANAGDDRVTIEAAGTRTVDATDTQGTKTAQELDFTAKYEGTRVAR
jgi:bacillolysin